MFGINKYRSTKIIYAPIIPLSKSVLKRLNKLFLIFPENKLPNKIRWNGNIVIRLINILKSWEGLLRSIIKLWAR
jgi:hypothetical protein